jgi:hypothetical protein
MFAELASPPSPLLTPTILCSDLCKRLEEESPQFPDPTGKKPLAFLKIMLNQLQTVFLEKIPHLTDEEALLKARSRALGNIVFIGEMFKHKLVHPTIVQRCIDEVRPSSIAFLILVPNVCLSC